MATATTPKLTVLAQQPEKSGSDTFVGETRLPAGQAIKLISRVLHRADPIEGTDSALILEGIREIVTGTGTDASFKAV